MSYLVRIKEIFGREKKTQEKFEIREKAKEVVDTEKNLALANLEAEKKIVTTEQKAHMLEAQVRKELYRNQMQRFS
jgi:hypothetical protein